MSNATAQKTDQLDLFEVDKTKTLLDQLLTDSKLYKNSQDYKELLDFVVRLRNFAPFNAMLLQIQKPGLSFAASNKDWRQIFRRKPKEGARPLLILWPFGPVALVYDVIDTEGAPLPQDVFSFYAKGDIDNSKVESFASPLKKQGIEWYPVDVGDNKAGAIKVLHRAQNEKEKTLYRMFINKNHKAVIQFTTVAHELGHLFLGHLGPDKNLSIPQRTISDHSERELEAESVAYIVCMRNGVEPKSQTYLRNHVDQHTTIKSLDLYQIMRAAGKVEKILGLTAETNFKR